MKLSICIRIEKAQLEKLEKIRYGMSSPDRTVSLSEAVRQTLEEGIAMNLFLSDHIKWMRRRK